MGTRPATPGSSWVSKCLKYILVAGAVLYVVLYLVIVFSRIHYPFELEWMEGGSVDHVRRILSGQGLYVSPSLEFVPFIYGPLYFYLSAGFSSALGVGFLPLRLVSFLSSLGCFALIFLIVERETQSKFAGILASGLFAATFRISGAWFDIARVDSLFLVLLLGAMYLIKLRPSPKSWVLAGVLVSLSFLTKQIALLIAMPLMLYCFLAHRRRSPLFIGTVAAIISTSTLILDHIHHGWYSYYVFRLPTQHHFIQAMFTGFWSWDIASPLFVAFAMSVLYIVSRFLYSDGRDHIFYSLMAVGMLGGAWLSRMHYGGYDNVLFPAYACIAILFGLATHTAFAYVRGLPAPKQKAMEILICFVCMMQFASLAYKPADQVPAREDLEAGWEFVDTMAQFEGEVLVPYHGYLPTLAGKSSFAQLAAVNDVNRGDDGQAKAKLVGEINDALEEKRFSAIIIDGPVWSWTGIDIEEYYAKEGPVFDSRTVFWPVTGKSFRPEYIYVPKGASIP